MPSRKHDFNESDKSLVRSALLKYIISQRKLLFAIHLPIHFEACPRGRRRLLLTLPGPPCLREITEK